MASQNPEEGTDGSLNAQKRSANAGVSTKIRCAEHQELLESTSVCPCPAKTAMVFVGNMQDEFDVKEELRTMAVKDRAFALKQIAQHRLDSGELGCAIAEEGLIEIKKQWPVLFGGKAKRIYVHADLDSFYASVEVMDNQSYKGVPMAVGSKSMLAAVNYKAREFGIKAGMPGYKALSLCPELVIQRLNFTKYNRCSEKVMEILSFYDPEIEIYGVDEACLVFDQYKLIRAYDAYNSSKQYGCNSSYTVPNVCNGLGDRKDSAARTEKMLLYQSFGMADVQKLVEMIRAVIHRNTGLTISAGISVCRGLSKYSSNIKKPNGQFTIGSDFDSHILHLPVGKINGIGKSTKQILEQAFGIKTVGDLRAKLAICAMAWKPKSFINLQRLSYGLSHFDSIGDITARPKPMQSYGISMTIRPTVSSEDVLFHLWSFAGILAAKLVGSGKGGTCLTLTIKYQSFDAKTTRRNNLAMLSTPESIFEHAVLLLGQRFKKDDKNQWLFEQSVRLIGLCVGDLVSLKEATSLRDFTQQPVSFKYRECIICNAVFVHMSQAVFEMHVNRCIDSTIKEEKKKPKTLLDHFKRL